MLAITVNGHEEKYSIGCRTFVSLDVLLGILEADVRQVTVNGETISSREFSTTTVKDGDALLLKR